MGIVRKNDSAKVSEATSPRQKEVVDDGYLTDERYGQIKGHDYKYLRRIKYAMLWEESEIIMLYDPSDLLIHFKNKEEAD
mmetsp:Transcript_29770/g.27247  ORF Transcript_29770/g.27247 Transcript_29770/m.27247 type:complete len:80 (-) Transcript_29770:1113-1352(-)